MDHANDMREMIRTEIRSINSLEERVAFKAVSYTHLYRNRRNRYL